MSKIVFRLALALAATGCSSSPEPAGPHPQGQQPPQNGSRPYDYSTPPSLANAPPPTDPRGKPGGPNSAEQCKSMAARDSGREDPTDVSLAPGAGQSERYAAVKTLLAKKRATFRCCYDVWLRSNPGRDAKVTLTWKLDTEGKVEKIDVDPKASTVTDGGLTGCMLDVARSLSYPASPSEEFNAFFGYTFGFSWHKE